MSLLLLTAAKTKPERPHGQPGLWFLLWRISAGKVGLIEHIINLQPFINRLIQLAKKQIIIATPCQKEFYYTLDEHLHFFPTKDKLTALFPVENFYCEKLDGDWLYIAELS